MRRIVRVVGTLFLFFVMTFLGFGAGRPLFRYDQSNVPGWCCVPEDNKCSVKENQPACLGAGGTLFTLDRPACETVCRK